MWSYETAENLHGVYYDFRTMTEGEETVFGDPYAKACGMNGKRSMAVDLKETDPEGWMEDRRPEKQEETVIYELHIKEFSWDEAGDFPKKTEENTWHLQKNIQLLIKTGSILRGLII